MTVLVTGAAGFIGFHLCSRLLREGIPVVGLDNINKYYDPLLKEARLSRLQALASETNTNYYFYKAKLEDLSELIRIFEKHTPDKVVNLAAQAGVRYSIDNPSAYIQSNLVGFGNILEACRTNSIEHLVYASSSSVYGGNVQMPFSETHGVDHPVSLYAASKSSNELMAHTYSHLYSLPCTGLRFFTVYGPWGRPDMALFLFTKAILAGEPIKIFNHGNMMRDFTYIDDIVESLVRLIEKPAKPLNSFNKKDPDPSKSWSPHLIFNIGNSSPIKLMEYIEAIESSLNLTAKKEFHPMQPGDVASTSADTSELEKWTGFKPNTPVKEGVNNFVQWYRSFYKI